MWVELPPAGIYPGYHIAVQDHKILTHLSWYLDLLLDQLYSNNQQLQHSSNNQLGHTQNTYVQ